MLHCESKIHRFHINPLYTVLVLIQLLISHIYVRRDDDILFHVALYLLMQYNERYIYANRMSQAFSFVLCVFNDKQVWWYCRSGICRISCKAWRLCGWVLSCCNNRSLFGYSNNSGGVWTLICRFTGVIKDPSTNTKEEQVFFFSYDIPYHTPEVGPAYPRRIQLGWCLCTIRTQIFLHVKY